MSINRLLVALGVLLFGALACGTSAPRRPLDLYPTPNALPTPTERVVIWTTTPNALPTPIVIVVTATPNATMTPNAQQVTAIQALNIRDGHAPNALVLVTLLKGTQVIVTGACVEGWVAVRFAPVQGIETGWVNADYLSGDVCRPQ